LKILGTKGLSAGDQAISLLRDLQMARSGARNQWSLSEVQRTCACATAGPHPALMTRMNGPARDFPCAALFFRVI
jgi:hypothetical protein